MNFQSWQALLFVPAGAARFVASAIKHRPDAVILDLEDGVAAEAKAAARYSLREHQALLAEAGIDCIIRVNPGIVSMMQDIDAADLSLTAALMVPKCIDTRVLKNAGELLEGREKDKSVSPVSLIALVESPSALSRLEEISEVPRLAGMMFGPEDYAAELGIPADSPALELAAILLTAACASRRLLPLGLAGPIGNFKDLDVYKAKVVRARHLGFRAAAAIHPAQLPALLAGFMPGEDELERARQIVSAFHLAAMNAKGAIALDGAMLDAPIVEQARRVLALASRDR